MHELSIVCSILDIIEEYAEEHRFKNVNSLKLSFGRLSCIEPQVLEFTFEIQSSGTKAEGALLEFDIKPIIIHCLVCEKDIQLDMYAAVCPQCNGSEVLLVGGTEMIQLLEIDVD
ncbi:MAG TPA: hydrogenase maturation nickel metallochaperone HypA [Syntrophales bacterium]|nr:hydrogenase maturation nickel metallochaperone HypA [Syntrophales bacterium]